MARAEALSTGNNVQSTLLNTVLFSIGLKAEHGAHLERTFEFKAFSSDGSTSPLTVVEAA